MSDERGPDDYTIERVQEEISDWAKFFAPYIVDDNEWYRDGKSIDGKDAGSLGELFSALEPAIQQRERAAKREVLEEFKDAIAVSAQRYDSVDFVEADTLLRYIKNEIAATTDTEGEST